MSETFNDIITYLKNPNGFALENLSIKTKLTIVLKVLVFAFILAFSFGMIISLFQELNLFEIGEHSITSLLEEKSKLFIVLMAVVLAPILEECIFRAPISLFKNKQKYFKYIFYGFALLFGFVHIFNYEITPEILLFSPLLVAPQISLGLLLGYLRVKLGLIYSITLHMLFNASLLIPFLLIMP